MRKPNTFSKTEWQIVVFIIENKANHCGLAVPGYGLADLSLAGARIIDWEGKLPKGDKRFFSIKLPEPKRAIEFLKRPGLLCKKIIEMERAQKGWNLTREAPDFILTLHDKRSKNPDDMNCVEWIVFALELGGLVLPDDVMTPTNLLTWCRYKSSFNCG